ncbi:glycosyltransferase family 4 protein [Acinetobacter sp. ANC 4641]|uniref:glycosyltransferase family 4 protein n=1 Tax=Acinetobacter sp. ANC 4641 TaxID=2529847 RepID=UPI001040A315|nr:glycosyltransferase family 1 protein [Acinetobacter sp. ANC 4641]TCB11933.1 glycosyltransferase family 1 protein [Acinetobacter sp. ANC 4641]
MPSTAALKRQLDMPFKFRFKRVGQQPVQERAVEQLIRPKLKIAIVTETWPPEINGVALSLLHLCQGLQQQGHKIMLIRPEQSRSCTIFLAEQECLVTAHKIPKYPSLQFGRPQWLKVAKAIEQFQPDVVHIVTEGPLGLLALQVAKMKKIVISSGFHSPFQEFSRFFDLAFLVKPIQHYLRWFHNNTNLTCVPSHDTARALQAHGITCPIQVISRGVDHRLFSPENRCEDMRQHWGVDNQTKVLLYVGRLSPEKEIHVLIDGYLQARRQQQAVRLVVVGDGPDKERLQQLDPEQQVIFMGNLTGQRLAEAYASSDVFVFASRVETFGNVVLEAMASGLPVLAYDYACAHAYVQNEQSGWLIDLKDGQGLIQRMQNLPALTQLHLMGQQARMQVKDAGWQRPVQQFEQALYGLVMT